MDSLTLNGSNRSRFYYPFSKTHSKTNNILCIQNSGPFCPSSHSLASIAVKFCHIQWIKKGFSISFRVLKRSISQFMAKIQWWPFPLHFNALILLGCKNILSGTINCMDAAEECPAVDNAKCNFISYPILYRASEACRPAHTIHIQTHSEFYEVLSLKLHWINIILSFQSIERDRIADRHFEDVGCARTKFI